MICGNINTMVKSQLIVLFDEEELTKTLIETYLKDLSFNFEVLKFNEFDETLIPATDEKKIIKMFLVVFLNCLKAKIICLL